MSGTILQNHPTHIEWIFNYKCPERSCRITRLICNGFLITNVRNDPAESPDLYAMDFYLWIHTERITYSATLNDVAKLKQKIDAS